MRSFAAAFVAFSTSATAVYKRSREEPRLRNFGFSDGLPARGELADLGFLDDDGDLNSPGPSPGTRSWSDESWCSEEPSAAD